MKIKTSLPSSHLFLQTLLLIFSSLSHPSLSDDSILTLSEWRDRSSSQGNSRPEIVINGGGSTFAAQTFLSWMAAYRSARAAVVDVRMNYVEMGSGWGEEAIKGELGPNVVVQYGVSDF